MLEMLWKFVSRQFVRWTLRFRWKICGFTLKKLKKKIIHDDWYQFHFSTIICIELNRGVSFFLWLTVHYIVTIPLPVDLNIFVSNKIIDIKIICICTVIVSFTICLNHFVLHKNVAIIIKKMHAWLKFQPLFVWTHLIDCKKIPTEDIPPTDPVVVVVAGLRPIVYL